ncbi:LpxL/LpxP family acyltransferase [Escherichia coli]
MEGYPTDENQAAAYMNKIIEKRSLRAPEQYLWIHRRFKTRRWEDRRCTFNKLLLLFPSSNRP